MVNVRQIPQFLLPCVVVQTQAYNSPGGYLVHVFSTSSCLFSN